MAAAKIRQPFANLNLALAGGVLSVVALGIVAWVAIGALRGQVERSWWIGAVDDARDALVLTVADYQRAPGPARFDRANAAFDRLERDIARLDDSGCCSEVSQETARSTAAARAAFDRAVAEEREANDALASVRRAVAAIAERAGEETFAARSAATASETESRRPSRQQRDSVERLRALMSAMVVAERIQQRVEAFARFDKSAASSSLSLPSEGLPPVCTPEQKRDPRIACRPTTARLRHALEAFRNAGAGEKAARTGATLAWAAGAYLRAADAVFEELSAALDVATSRAAEEQRKTAALRVRSLALSRLNRALVDMGVIVDALGRTAADDLDALGKRFRGAHDQARRRSVFLFSAQTVGTARASEMRRRIDGVEVAWSRAIRAAWAQRASAGAMASTLDRMGKRISDATANVRRSTSEWIDVFASFAAVVLGAVTLAAIGAGWAAYDRVARPLARVTAAILALARGEVSDPIVQRGESRGFARLFVAIETLRRANIQRLALERSNARAELRIERQRAEAERLETALRDEQEKIRFQRRIISLVNHELRTPLAVIDGHARWILRKLGKADEDAVRERAATIRRSVMRLTGLMETFLLNARIESGRLEYRPALHDLSALIADVCAMQAEAAPSHRIDLDHRAAPTAFFGDERLLRQALSNLLSNAVKYSPDADRIEVRCEASGDGYRIAVRDYGVGVPADEIAKLGGQFFRASTSGNISGTGVGLNLVKAVLEAHGGTLEVGSEVGVGSTFTICLPASAPDADADAAHAAVGSEAVTAAAG